MEMNVVAAIVLSGVLAGPAVPWLDVHGHRGCAGLQPENTLPAFETALDLGVNTLELDVRVTRDRRLVVHHDARLRKGKCEWPDGTRPTGTPIRELDLDTVTSVVCGAAIPSFDEVLELAVAAPYAVALNVEIKDTEDTPDISTREIVALVVAAIERHGLGDRTMVQSFSPEVLSEVRDEAPDITRSVLVRSPGSYERALATCDCQVLSPKAGALGRADVEAYRARGIRVIPWTVNRPERIRALIDWGVDGMISDYPDRVIAVAEEIGGPPGD